MSITLGQIWLYPIKSLGGVQVNIATITEAGSLGLDREWIVVDRDDNMVWQGDLPRMALTRCSLDDTAITVTAPGLSPLTVAREPGGAPRTITMYKHEFAAIDSGDEPAGWLSEALGAPVRLVRIGAGAHRWSGLNPVHAISTASLRALNEALLAQGDETVEMERFRPNLVLEGTDEAFLEERHQSLGFGTASLNFREPCVRCELPNISRIDASRGKQPLKLIGALSRKRPTAVPASFGIYGSMTGTAIAVGTVGVAGRMRAIA